MSTLALTIVPAELGDVVASLTSGVLYVDAAAPVEDQLWAIGEAVEYLRTGRTGSGHRQRHLHLVTAAAMGLDVDEVDAGPRNS